MTRYLVPFRLYLVRWCLLNVLLFWTAVAQADDVIVPVKKGAVVPFDGQLFDSPTALHWGLLLQNAQDKLDARVDKERGICKAQLDYKDAILKIQLEKDDTLIDDLKRRVLRSDGARAKAEYTRDHPAWYSTAWFGIGVGALSTIAVVLVAHQAF